MQDHTNTTVPSTSQAQPELAQPATYEVKGRKFVVQPVFQPEGQDTLCTVLLRLMQADFGLA